LLAGRRQQTPMPVFLLFVDIGGDPVPRDCGTSPKKTG
jgi:hypothetical protein